MRISTPYVSDEERAKKNYFDGKKKWINHNGFNNYVGRVTKSYVIPTYVVRTPGEIASDHKFRMIDKRKWVGGKNFSLL